MKRPYTKTIALRLLLGLASKVKAVREYFNCIQVTYFANGGWCSTFLSKIAFIAGNDQQREEASSQIEVVEVVSDDEFICFSHKSNSYYVVRPYHMIKSERCECADCYYRLAECKHQKAVKQFLSQQFVLAV